MKAFFELQLMIIVGLSIAAAIWMIAIGAAIIVAKLGGGHGVVAAAQILTPAWVALSVIWVVLKRSPR